MKKQTQATPKHSSAREIIRKYTYAYFDHLHSEYLRVAPTIDSEKKHKLEARLGPIMGRRESNELTWDDVYAFDLEILDLLSEEDLVRKAYDMRTKYRSIAGPRDYDAYIASKPPDLTSLQLEASRKPEERALVAIEVLRADIRYLLSQFYLHYSMMPLREGLRDDMTHRARKWTLIFMVTFASLAILIFIGTSLTKPASDNPVLKPEKDNPLLTAASWTAWWVVFAGIMGGCVSMLQRIQSAPHEGDALYNLAALSHGWKGISLSPLYGAIFAALIYVLFTAGILEGAVFPKIGVDTPEPEIAELKKEIGETKKEIGEPKKVAGEFKSGADKSKGGFYKDEAASPSPSPSTSPNTSPSTSPTPAQSSRPSPAPGPALGPSPNTELKKNKARYSDKQNPVPFSNTSPVETKDYALLVIWCFIAGFAERLVPDTLNRLVAKNQSIQGTDS